MRDDIKQPIKQAYPVPPHIAAAGGAVAYDLLHGPSYVVIPQGKVELYNPDCLATLYDDARDEAEPGDVISETYTSAVADALRAWIDDLPSRLWVDTDAGCVSESEPEGFEDEETGEWVEPEWSSYAECDRDDIVRALFGETIAGEFR